MEKQLITVHPNNQDLSSTDLKVGLETATIATNNENRQENQAANYLRNATNSLLELFTQAEAERERKRAKQREAEQATEHAQRLKALKQAYQWKLKKTENLKLALAILTNTKDKIQLIPTFNQQAFLETVNENLDTIERRLLADIVYQMFDNLNDQINKILSCDNLDLFYTYHTRGESSRVWKWDSNPVCDGREDEPKSEFIEMEAENNILMNLYSELDGLVTIEANQKELEQLRQALKA